jgi:hypothetical protein
LHLIQDFSIIFRNVVIRQNDRVFVDFANLLKKCRISLYLKLTYQTRKRRSGHLVNNTDDISIVNWSILCTEFQLIRIIFRRVN